MSKKILFVVTNFSKINDDILTGVWLGEFAQPYIVFESTGYDITVASPLGGNSPLDENGLSCSNPIEWDEPAKLLRNTAKLSEIDYTQFDSILKNKHITSFTDKEEKIVKMAEFMPFSLEERIKKLGAIFVEDKPWSEHVEINCNIITGQNQNSALLAAEAVISLL